MSGNSADVGVYHALEQILDEEFSSSSDLRKLFQRRRSVSFTTGPESNEKGKNDEVKTTNKVSGESSGRPSTMLIHDNDDLLQLANQLKERQRGSLGLAGQRRGSSIVIQKAQTIDYPMSPSLARRSVSVRNEIRRVEPGGKKVPDNLPKSKLTSASLGKSSGGKLSSLGHLFGSGNKKSVNSGLGYNSSSVGVQSKIAKKVDRQTSKEPSTSSGLEDRRSQFTQARSSTGLNFFSNRRRSVVVSDEMQNNVSLRPTRSHLNLFGVETDQEKEVEEMYHTPETAVKPIIQNVSPRKVLSKKMQQSGGWKPNHFTLDTVKIRNPGHLQDSNLQPTWPGCLLNLDPLGYEPENRFDYI